MNTPTITPHEHDIPTRLRGLSDRDLVARTSALAREERAATIELLHHLNEIARRKAYLELGFSSLHDYCVRGLSYSSPSACRRIRAARCIREFPDVLRLLERGELDLGTISLIEPVLTEDNHGAVVARVRGRTYRQVKRVVAEYGPVLAIAEERIEPVRTAVTPANIDAALFEREVARAMPHGTVRSETGWVVSEQRILVQFLASEDLMLKYEAARALLSHGHPGASFAEVLDVLLGEFIERHSPQARQRRRDARRAAAASGKSSTVGADGGREDGERAFERVSTMGAPPRQAAGKSETGPASHRPRHIPASTRDEVFARDAGQCTYVAHDGTRCEARHGLQVDHVQPWAAGGGNEASNLRLLCGAHNRVAAEHSLGRHVMARYWRRQ